MAHYIAEKIENIKTSTGADRESKRRECYKLILELWQHRSSLPQSKRPFEDFEPALRSLAALAPSASPRIYFRSPWSSEPEEAVRAGSPDWLRIVAHIDSAVTAIVSYCVRMATQAAAEKGREWIEAADAAGSTEGPDIEAVRKLLEIDVDFIGSGRKSPTAEERLLERLDALDKISKELRTLVTPASTGDADPEHPHQGQTGQTEIG
jgi:hypothetical protein